MSLIEQQLLCLEEDFLSALGAGDQAMAAFERQWQKLLDDIDETVASPDFDSEISALVHTSALRIATLAETSVALFTSYDSLTGELVGELDCLMAELSLSDISSPLPSPSHPNAEHPNLVSRSSVEPSPSVSRKRRRASSDDEEKSFVPKRRCRTAKVLCPPSDNHHHQSSSPCAITSTSRTLISSIAPTYASAPRSSKRKRCLSDSDSLTTPNLSKRLHVGPRLSAVSGSFINPPIILGDPSPPIVVVDPGDLPGADGSLSNIANIPLQPAIPILTTDDSIPLDVEPLGDADLFTSLDYSPHNNISIHRTSSMPCASPLDTILTHHGIDNFLATLLHPCGQPSAPPPSGLNISAFEFVDHIFGDAPSPTSTASSPATSPSCPLTPPPEPDLALGPAFYEFDLDAPLEDGSFFPTFGNDTPMSLISFGEGNGVAKDSILGFTATIPQRGVVSQWDVLPDTLSTSPPQAPFVSI